MLIKEVDQEVRFGAITYQSISGLTYILLGIDDFLQTLLVNKLKFCPAYLQ